MTGSTIALLYQDLSKIVILSFLIKPGYLSNQNFSSFLVGTPNATTLKNLGSKYYTIFFIVAPFPAVSLPSNTTATEVLFLLIHS